MMGVTYKQNGAITHLHRLTEMSAFFRFAWSQSHFILLLRLRISSVEISPDSSASLSANPPPSSILAPVNTRENLKTETSTRGEIPCIVPILTAFVCAVDARGRAGSKHSSLTSICSHKITLSGTHFSHQKLLN